MDHNNFKMLYLLCNIIFSWSLDHISLQFYVEKSRARPIQLISAISSEINLKSTSFSLKTTINGENCHSQISSFTQMVKYEFTFTLDSQWQHITKVIQFVIRMFKDWMHATLFKLHGITYKRQFFLQQPFLWCWLLWASTMRKREFADKMPVSQQMPLTAKILGFQLGLWDYSRIDWRSKGNNRDWLISASCICLINLEYLIVFCHFRNMISLISTLEMAEILFQVPFTTWLFSRWRPVC